MISKSSDFTYIAIHWKIPPIYKYYSNTPSFFSFSFLFLQFCRLHVPNSRCSHCAFTTDIRQISVIMNTCTTAPEDDPNSYCHHSLLFMCSCGQRLPAPVNQLRSPTTQNKIPQQDVITAANPPDLTGSKRVDLSAWAKQAVLSGGGGSLPAVGLLASSWMQDIAGPNQWWGGYMDCGWIWFF